MDDLDTEIKRLSKGGKDALATTLSDLPNDCAAPVPLCERVNQLRDALGVLEHREDLPETDRQIFAMWMRSDMYLFILTEFVNAVDRLRSLLPI